VPTTHHDVFLQDILATPGDDTPRLIYADWLEDNGDLPRSEFIRVQCRLTRLSPAEHPPEWRQREQFLLGRHGALWRRNVPAWLRSGVVFRRGFIDEFNSTARAFFMDDPNDFWSAAPTAAVLRLSRIDERDLARLRTLAALPRLRELELREPRTGRDWVVAAIRLGGSVALRAVRLTRCYLSDNALSALLEKTWNGSRLEERAWLERLEHLGLADNRLTDDCIPSLLNSPSVRRLLTLDLTDNPLSADGIARLRKHLGSRLIAGDQSTAEHGTGGRA
jgi:uncharacterized protein (TIGR02996 family)